MIVALSQHEQQVLAELEAQLSRTRSRLRLSAHRFSSIKLAVQPAALVTGLVFIAVSIFVWWPLAVIGYALAAFGAVGVINRSSRHFSWIQERMAARRSRSEPSAE
jgi:hypothetical protein